MHGPRQTNRAEMKGPMKFTLGQIVTGDHESADSLSPAGRALRMNNQQVRPGTVLTVGAVGAENENAWLCYEQQGFIFQGEQTMARAALAPSPEPGVSMIYWRVDFVSVPVPERVADSIGFCHGDPDTPGRCSSASG
jgi:hypothetical protein